MSRFEDFSPAPGSRQAVNGWSNMLGSHSKVARLDPPSMTPLASTGGRYSTDAFLAGTDASRNSDREAPELRRTAAIIAHDTLFLSLQGDANSRQFAEDRVLEILRENIIPPLQQMPGMTDFMNSSLRNDNNNLRTKVAELDEVFLFFNIPRTRTHTNACVHAADARVHT